MLFVVFVDSWSVSCGFVTMWCELVCDILIFWFVDCDLYCFGFVGYLARFWCYLCFILVVLDLHLLAFAFALCGLFVEIRFWVWFWVSTDCGVFCLCFVGLGGFVYCVASCLVWLPYVLWWFWLLFMLVLSLMCFDSLLRLFRCLVLVWLVCWRLLCCFVFVFDCFAVLGLDLVLFVGF